MKTKTTDTTKQLAKLNAAMSALTHRADVPRLYRCESSDPTYDAQRNLNGRTHYADPDTLRFHKGRILSAGADADGLLFLMLTSDAADPDNKRRVFRVVAFDMFGDVIFRETLEEAATTAEGARKRFAGFSVNLTEHYRAVLVSRCERLTRDLSEFKAGIKAIGKRTAKTNLATF